MTPEVAKYGKDLLALRGFLLGREWFRALDALEFARNLHDGLRKDGRTPEFHHQVFMANFARTILPSLLKPEVTLAAILLHDVPEDYDVSFEQIDTRFGTDIGNPVRLLTKKKDGVVIPYPVYFGRIAEDPVASVGKGIDRAHNIFTMSGANWSPDKQSNYLDEAENYFLPMLKTARRNFPQQEPAYQNIKTMLMVQSVPIRLSLERARLLEVGLNPAELEPN